MFNEFFFCPGDEALAASAEDLQRELVAELGSPHTVHLHEGGTRLQLVDFGITLTLTAEQNGNVLCAATVIPASTDIRHVVAMCRAFRDLGWEF